MTNATRRFFLSDLHLGMNTPTDWYQPAKHKAPVLAVLDYIGQQENVKDLVLNGDIFDSWNIPAEAQGANVYTVRDIVQSNLHDDFWKEVATLCQAKKINLYYLNGNHDMSTTHEDLDVLKARFAADGLSIRWISKYQGGLLYAEHGSRFAMFNAPDRIHDPAEGIPLGYFITRLLAGDHAYTSFNALASYVDDALEAAITTETIAQAVLEAVMERHNRVFPKDLVSPTTVIHMPGGRTMTLADVKVRYKDLFDLWSSKFGYWYCINALRAEIGALGWFADRLCSNQGYKVVVLGHTHDTESDADGILKTKWTYINTGKMCSETPTFGEVDKLGDRFDCKLWRMEKDVTAYKAKQIGKTISVGR